MSEAFWQAKIRGLVYNLDLSALNQYTGNRAEPFFRALEAIAPLATTVASPSPSDISHVADLITDASDRAVLNAAHRHFNANDSNVLNTVLGQTNAQALTVSHLLSGKKLAISPQLPTQLNSGEFHLPLPPDNIDSQQLFWWLWRCLPQAICEHDQSLMLVPAAASLPDASVWSHASLRAAIAGTLATYGRTPTQRQQHSTAQDLTPRPYLAIFSFTPVQELIKASRKMRDFWAGSWLLHYLSAKVCWKLALAYGPDSLIYPSLYQQPLIDQWLRREYQGFDQWIDEPSPRALLTAGFPNVIVAVLPKGEVKAAMQTAKQTLYSEWLKLGDLVFDELKGRHWTRKLRKESRTWEGWLKTQWQPYWTALPLGKEGRELTEQAVLDEKEDHRKYHWIKDHNQACNLAEEEAKLFHLDEFDFVKAVKTLPQLHADSSVSVNVGSWWPYVFDQLRFGLSAVKNARTWDIPTAFSPRSTISGIGPVVYPDSNEYQPKGKNQHRPIAERDTKDFWQNHAGLFDGIEQLNATETLKRGIHLILPNPEVLGLQGQALNLSYPDLTAGVAGYLKADFPKNKSQTERIEHFQEVCESVLNQLDEFPEGKRKALEDMKWGIPWIEQHQDIDLRSYPSRLLNAGWLVADLEIPDESKPDYRTQLQRHIAQYYPKNNPADWYVLAAGDGDGMSRWLKGLPLQNYQNYILEDYQPSTLSNPSDREAQRVNKAFEQLKLLQKRMGPSTHNALSRALLDFSNQLLPYLTEQRYAGRLIYGGGDDVLAYINLWEWDSWLWDVRQCFRGAEDKEQQEFKNDGDYWQWQKGNLPKDFPTRPLFTMGSEATISFGIVIAHHSVPLAIAIENLWEAEKDGAKEHYCPGLKDSTKNAVQVRVLYGNGNSLKATSKFEAFNEWRSLLYSPVDAALFEQAAQIWSQHPAPQSDAIAPWTQAFCNRRDIFKGNEQAKKDFQQSLKQFLCALQAMTQEEDRDREIQNWLKLAAFVLRKREIDIR
ncbi:type III-B CRISPR-associated protein Cas10/Cmr2 [Microcoleus sp. FACHB-53]|nr:type III-B CRISPR-associated protein Cas10/Cmr2 [Microcoleus sp. FACHB-53]